MEKPSLETVNELEKEYKKLDRKANKMFNMLGSNLEYDIFVRDYVMPKYKEYRCWSNLYNNWDYWLERGELKNVYDKIMADPVNAYKELKLL